MGSKCLQHTFNLLKHIQMYIQYIYILIYFYIFLGHVIIICTLQFLSVPAVRLKPNIIQHGSDEEAERRLEICVVRNSKKLYTQR